MKKYAGIIIVFLFLAVHLITINDYGLTWDYHFHFFGGGKLLGLTWQQLDPRPLPYVEPDPRRADNLPYGPIMSIPPVASYLLLSRTWRLLPSDSAYNLPIILWGVLGIAVLYLFLKEAFNQRVAVLGALFLALTPRYFGDLHNNMKDPPSAAAFALNMWLLFRLVKRKRPIDLLFAVLAFALAFNVKINAVYIPVIFGVWVGLLYMPRLTRVPKRFWWYGPLAPLAALGLWSVFWPHPISQLIQAYSTFGIGTNNIEVVLRGAWYCSGSSVPWYYPWWYLGITTPIPILLFFFSGIALFTANAVRKKKQPALLLILLWLVLPLTRYFVRSIGVIDGIRHFEEVVFPIAALSAVGFEGVLRFLRRTPRYVPIVVIIAVFSWLSWANISYHPYQIAYFNELVGGAKGAFGRYDLDYWGTSQKAAVEWVNRHAAPNAKVFIVMAPDVAGTYLRPDLMTNLNRYGYTDSDYVIFLNRQSFYYRFFYAFEYLLTHKPVYTVSVQGAPLTWIFDNAKDRTTKPQKPWWRGEDPCIIPYWRNK